MGFLILDEGLTDNIDDNVGEYGRKLSINFTILRPKLCRSLQAYLYANKIDIW